MAEASAKNNLTIGTHNGHFHADEALAVYMLRLLPTYRDSKLIRTRDPAILETCDIVVDVGGVYDASKNRYDHHQRTFNTTFPDRPTKLSSAGLIYMHFGKAIISQHLDVHEAHLDVDILWKKLYQSFIEALDAHDNGIDAYDPMAIKAAGLEKRFSDGGFTLGAMVSRMNPNWNESREGRHLVEDKKFSDASDRIGEEFSRDLMYYISAWWPARDIVRKAFDKRLEFDPSGRILVFGEQSVPWKDHLFTLEAQEGVQGKVLYVLYPEDQTEASKWRIQCVPASKDSFESRKPMPDAWRGQRDEDLDQFLPIEGGIFVHSSGFIGGHRSFDGALDMAVISMQV